MQLQVVFGMSPKKSAKSDTRARAGQDTLTSVHVTLGVGCRLHIKSCTHTICLIHMLFFLIFVSPCAFFFGSESNFACT